MQIIWIFSRFGFSLTGKQEFCHKNLRHFPRFLALLSTDKALFESKRQYDRAQSHVAPLHWYEMSVSLSANLDAKKRVSAKWQPFQELRHMPHMVGPGQSVLVVCEIDFYWKWPFIHLFIYYLPSIVQTLMLIPRQGAEEQNLNHVSPVESFLAHRYRKNNYWMKISPS